MTPHPDSPAYSPKVWSQAPASATHWGIVGVSRWFVKIGDALHIAHVSGGRGNQDFSGVVIDLHERPHMYRTPEQLIAEYKKGHGAEIEADVQTFLDGLGSPPLMAHRLMKLDELLDDALFHLVLIERHLAAERARIEGQS